MIDLNKSYLDGMMEWNLYTLLSEIDANAFVMQIDVIFTKINSFESENTKIQTVVSQISVVSGFIFRTKRHWILSVISIKTSNVMKSSCFQMKHLNFSVHWLKHFKINKQISGPPYAPVTLPIMCKCMYRNSLRTTTCNTALKDKVISYLKQIMLKKFSQV